MIKMKRVIWAVNLLVIASLCLIGCGPVNGGKAGTSKIYKLAAIFPGLITDADYNSMGYLGSMAVKRELGIETTYTESVPTTDFQRITREKITGGYNIIWAHGAQFLDLSLEVAKTYPDVTFIVEGDSKPEGLTENVWFIDRNFHIGFYGLGALACMITSTNKIGYITGPELPFTYSEVRAIQQAIADSGKAITLYPVWTGDLNDPAIAKIKTDEFISEDVDVVLGSLNLGMQGVFESVKANKDRHILVTAKYSDKSQFAPENYVTSLLYDFSHPVVDVVKKIQSGEKGGYYPLGFDTGVRLQTPLMNVPEEVNKQIQTIVSDLQSGKITVVKDITPIQ